MTHFNHLLDDVMRTHAGAPMALEVARELARLTTDASDDERQALQQAAQARGLYVQQPGESDDDTLYHAVLLCRQYVERHQAYKPVRVIAPGPLDTSDHCRIENPCEALKFTHGPLISTRELVAQAMGEMAGKSWAAPMVHRRLIEWADRLMYRDDRQHLMTVAQQAGFDISPEGLARVEVFYLRASDPQWQYPGMIYMLTNERLTRRDGSLEPDLLVGNETKPLIVTTLEGEEIARREPPSCFGWNRHTLLAASMSVVCAYPEVIKYGAEAHLGGVFVGSTEC
mgnify:FL=1